MISATTSKPIQIMFEISVFIIFCAAGISSLVLDMEGKNSEYLFMIFTIGAVFYISRFVFRKIIEKNKTAKL
jgi:hypothetical protein